MDLTLLVVILGVLLFVAFIGAGYAFSTRTLNLKKRVDTNPEEANHCELQKTNARTARGNAGALSPSRR